MIHSEQIEPKIIQTQSLSRVQFLKTEARNELIPRPYWGFELFPPMWNFSTGD